MSERVGISQDERYPFFHLSDEWGEATEVPTETIKRWREVMDAFEAVQDEMGAEFEKVTARNARLAAIAKAEKVAADAQAKLEALRNESTQQ